MLHRDGIRAINEDSPKRSCNLTVGISSVSGVMSANAENLFGVTIKQPLPFLDGHRPAVEKVHGFLQGFIRIVRTEQNMVDSESLFGRLECNRGEIPARSHPDIVLEIIAGTVAAFDGRSIRHH